MDPETIIYSKQGRIAHLLLNRPRVVNAYNIRMRDELFQALEAVRDDPDVLVAILSGAGDRGFCAGADLTEFGTAPSQVVARLVRWERDLWGLFLEIGKPLIAALHGYVVGSGVEIGCLCDIRIASEDAVFRMPEVALGMVPAAGGTQTLSRTIGVGPALDVLLTGRSVPAEEALALGLVHRVVPKGELLEAAERIAQELASHSPDAVAAAKSAVLSGMDMPLSRGIDLEERLVAQLAGPGAAE